MFTELQEALLYVLLQPILWVAAAAVVATLILVVLLPIMRFLRR